MSKVFVTAEDLLQDSYLLASKVVDSGFRPDYIVAVLRGGAPVAIATHEFLDAVGIPTILLSVEAKFYKGIDETEATVKVFGSSRFGSIVGKNKKVLIVDDIFDTGQSMSKLAADLYMFSSCGNAFVRQGNMKFATPWYKPARNKTVLTPHYYVHETDDWVVFPHEVKDLTDDELQQHKPELYKLMQESKR